MKQRIDTIQKSKEPIKIMKQRADLKNRLKMKQENDFIVTNREKFNIVIINFGKFNGFWRQKYLRN